jgi:hypothetical protein
MLSTASVNQDVMQVCRNGHVITDLLRANPDSGLTHCDRCGASTIDCCPTCGRDLPGALTVPVRPVGSRQPPMYCCHCGAAFSWTLRSDHSSKVAPVVRLEGLLHRLPEVIRQLRTRQGDRTPFRVTDVWDLEDLVRAMLPIQFDDVRPESRTPRYSAINRTDFLLTPERIALTVKWAAPELASQLEEDIAYYRRHQNCRTLVCFIYDPEGSLRHFATPDLAALDPDDTMAIRWVVGMP